jgi:acyl-CoA dehydrogenase
MEHSEKVRTLQARVESFMAEHIYPNEEELFAQVSEGDRWQPVPLLEELKAKARAAALNVRKWWTSGALDPRCKIVIVMGQSDADNPDRYRRQSMILVPLPHPGVVIKPMLPVFGYDEAPHGHAEVLFDNVRIPAANMLLGEGGGFEIAQGRLGPRRIHHCMRLIGLAERALERNVRTMTRTAFGARISDQSVTQERIAEGRIMIEQARLLTLKAAWMMDKYGNKEARAEIAMIKVAAPNMACRVIDWAIQAFGGAGVTGDYGLAYAYATARVLRLADGPDEVHRNQIARLELRKYQGSASLSGGSAEVLPPDTSPDLRRRPVWIA